MAELEILQMPATAGHLQPLPFHAGEKPGRDLDIQIKIDGPGGFFDLEDGVHYELHADTLASASVSFRQATLDSPYIEGSYPITSVRENITEVVAVWVYGETYFEWLTYRDKLLRAFEQLSYLMMVRIEDAAEYWSCQPAAYTWETSHELLHARAGIVRAQVPRLPTAQLVPAASDET